MGTFKVDAKSTPGMLRCHLKGSLSDTEVRAFVTEHDAAIRSFGTMPYRVFVDLRELLPLAPSAAAIMANAKEFSSSRSNFRGSAVLVTSRLIALQHRRTSEAAGVLDTEFTSESEDECWNFLRKVHRST